MYNVYKHTKIQNEKKTKESEEIVQEKAKENRKSNLFLKLERMPELVDNYNKRVKKFVYEMVESPVKIHQFVSPHMNTTSRQQYNLEKNKELFLTGKLPRNFSFHTFQTDKERISKYVQSKEMSFYQTGKENETKKIESPRYLQPSMRFKPRTELERIYETVNKYSFGRINKELINEQLRNLDMLNSKTNPVKKDNNLTFSHIGNRFKISSNILQILKDERDVIIKGNKHHEVTKNINSIIEKNEKLLSKRISVMADSENKIPKKDFRQLVDKTIAQSLMKDLHVKTHFKGATNFSLNLKQAEEQKKIFKQLHDFENLDVSVESNASFENKTRIKSKFKSDDLNPVLYNIDFNPMKTNKYEETKNVKKETLEYLELISKPPVLLKPEQFDRKSVISIIESLKGRRTDMNSLLKANPAEFFKQYKEGLMQPEENRREEEKVTIGKEVYFKSQIDSISRSVLKQCNFTREKNENNNSYLKAGAGKLAITNGMTVNEFRSKYKLQDT